MGLVHTLLQLVRHISKGAKQLGSKGGNVKVQVHHAGRSQCMLHLQPRPRCGQELRYKMTSKQQATYNRMHARAHTHTQLPGLHERHCSTVAASSCPMRYIISEGPTVEGGRFTSCSVPAYETTTCATRDAMVAVQATASRRRCLGWSSAGVC